MNNDQLYIWRGGKKIPVERAKTLFTLMPQERDHLGILRMVPGVRDIRTISDYIYKVETVPHERDDTMSILRSEKYNAIVHHAYRPLGTEGSVFYITDRIFLIFTNKATIRQINGMLKKYALKVLRKYEHEINTYLVQVTSSSRHNPVTISNRLAGEKIVESAEPNLVNRFAPAYFPSDPYFKKQWYLFSEKGAQLVGNASVNAPAAWDVTRGDRRIVVAVIDDGFDLSHPDFSGKGKVIFPKDYVDGDTKPFPEAENGDYHGTPCAGIAIAECNGMGVVGIAHGCSFMPVRFPLAADDEMLIDVFTETADKADVISCSWGPPPVFAPLSLLFHKTLTRLATTSGPKGKGTVICFAAGNFNAPLNDIINSDGFRWMQYNGVLRKTTGPIVNGNAIHPEVMAVGASTSINSHALYSNWGSEISVCAPANNFHPLDFKKNVPGRGIWTTDNEVYGSGFKGNRRYTGIFGGTSAATPLTAGIAALVLSANPGLHAAGVRNIIETTADKIKDKGSDHLGKNRSRYINGHSEWFGYGKVNAWRAVKEAVRRGEAGSRQSSNQ